MRAGFALWQTRRIEAYVTENLEHSVSIKTLAGMVSLSARHFCRAFKQSFGKTRHAYLIGFRVAHGRATLREIALARGWADQAHLDVILRGCVGVAPSAWRRLRQRAWRQLGS